MSIILSDLTKRFGDNLVVNRVSLEIQNGELFVLLGGSGSGKSTILRMIAGLTPVDEGRIELDGRDVTFLAPQARGTGFVFQNYSIFRHMTVSENIEFGLRIRKSPLAKRRERSDELLELVGLAGLGARYPDQLSGGQRQRVALARALINHPRVLLLDEPLGALDLKLRQQMQIELKSIQQRVGITFIYVTHDQEEALTMSDRIAVFNQGKIEQLGSPAEIYEHPATPFVAGFVGVSNLIEGMLAQAITGAPDTFSIRPEKIQLAPPGTPVTDDQYAVDGRVRDVIYLGLYTRYLVSLEGGSDLVVVKQNLDTTSMDVLSWRGQPVRLIWQRDHNRLVNAMEN